MGRRVDMVLNRTISICGTEYWIVLTYACDAQYAQRLPPLHNCTKCVPCSGS